MKLKNLLVKESTNTLDAVLAQLPMMAKNGVSELPHPKGCGF